MSGKLKVPAELDILISLEQGEVVSQARLSKRIAVSVGLINALLKRAMRKGYVKATSAPYKRYAYYLTPTGFSEKSRLVAEYLEHSLAFFRAARQEYGEIFARAHASGIRRVAFLGGELAEIALLAAREAHVAVACVVDRDAEKDHMHGIAVMNSLGDLKGIDAVVITDARAPQEVFELARTRFPDSRILAPHLLRITRAPLDFKPKVAKP